MYVIVANIWEKYTGDDELSYLAWQPGTWDDGYFWTRKDIFIECLPYNTAGHRFVFHRIEDAWRAISNLNLKTGYVIKWEGP